MHSVAKSTAVSNPNVAVVLSRSLSIVFGTPITRSPFSIEVIADPQRSVAADGDQRVDAFVGETLDQLGSPVDLDPGAVVLLHRIRRRVAPIGRPEHGATEMRDPSDGLAVELGEPAVRVLVGMHEPLKPSRIPTTSHPRLRAATVADRMTALSPGASPPPVLIAIFETFDTDARVNRSPQRRSRLLQRHRAFTFGARDRMWLHAVMDTDDDTRPHHRSRRPGRPRDRRNLGPRSPISPRCSPSNGARVVATGRRLERLTEVADEITCAGGTCLPLQLDVTDAEQLAEVVRTAEAELGPVQILVNNAGIPDAQYATKMELELIDQVLDTNLRAPYVLSCEVARRLIELKLPGRMVNISSVGGFHYSGGGAALYSITKAGVNRLTETLAVEWSRFGINVNAIAPGSVRVGDVRRDDRADGRPHPGVPTQAHRTARVPRQHTALPRVAGV